MAETQVLDGFGAGDAPRTRETKSSEQLTMLDVVATFDGSAAAGAFVPAVIIESDAGHVVGAFPLQDTLQVGDSATVTFAPFLSGGAAGAIRYVVLNDGTWLSVEANGADGAGRAMFFESSGGGEIVFSIPGAAGTFRVTAPLIFFDANGGIFRFYDASLIDAQPDVFNVLAQEIILSATGGGVETVELGPNVDVELRAGQSVTINNSVGAPIAEIREDGSWHGRAAVGAITWDL